MMAAYEGARNIDRRLRGGCHVSSGGVCNYVANQDLIHAIGRKGRAVGSLPRLWTDGDRARAGPIPQPVCKPQRLSPRSGAVLNHRGPKRGKGARCRSCAR